MDLKYQKSIAKKAKEEMLVLPTDNQLSINDFIGE